jgi:hypothetical protein
VEFSELDGAIENPIRTYSNGMITRLGFSVIIHAPADVLLIDEIDRSDEEFEAFLLEVLSDFQISIPEIGTMKAERPPLVILTSNRTREIHDALKRRCLFHWIDYPSFEKEYAIVRTKVPGIAAHLASQVCQFAGAMRQQDFYKRPGVAETLVGSSLTLGGNVWRFQPSGDVGMRLEYKDLDKANEDLLETISTPYECKTAMQTACIAEVGERAAEVIEQEALNFVASCARMRCR